jgi:salicylate hydroxylase
VCRNAHADCFPTQLSQTSGGGIGGLCLAVALSRYPDIHVDVYEAAERFKEIGAGVMIWAKTWRTLELLGLAIDASKVSHAPPDPSPGTVIPFVRWLESHRYV